METCAAQPPPGTAATSMDPPHAQAEGSRGTGNNVEVKHQMKQNRLKKSENRWLEEFVREPGSRLSIPLGTTATPGHAEGAEAWAPIRELNTRWTKFS